MNEEQLNVIRQLRKQGFAVCIFTPEELQCSTPEKVEDAMCEAGRHALWRFSRWAGIFFLF